jgi:hypothetical protein
MQMQKGRKPDQKDKVVLPDNIFEMISVILKDLDQIKSVVDDIHTGNYQKAVSDLLAVIESIINDLILPKVLPKSKAPQQPSEGSEG